MEKVQVGGIAGTDERRDRQLLLDRIVGGGYCIGCGACASVPGSGLAMALDAFGEYKPVIAGADETAAVDLLSICPFGDAGPDETTIAGALYPDAAWHDGIGRHRACYAGHVASDEFRALGSSGGLGKWIGHELLRRGLVDHLVQVVAADPSEVAAAPDGSMPLYRYAIVSTPETAKAGSKSVYYPVEMSAVLARIREGEGRFAITGVPCFIKAIRRLCATDPRLAERIRFCIGIICGHLKSSRYAEMLAWQAGIAPGELAGVDFRRKYPGATAKQKGMEFVTLGAGGEERRGDIVQTYFGTRYDLGFFKYDACDYCDDVIAETADVAVGDAWLPEYVADGGGTSVVVARHPEIQAMLDEGVASGALHLDRLDADQVARSQAGGLRHRRDGLAFRLHLKDEAGAWRPPKRVVARADHLNAGDRNKYLVRLEIAARSREEYAAARTGGTIDGFIAAMTGHIDAFERRTAPRPPLWRRVAGRVLRPLRRALGRSPTAATHAATRPVRRG